MEGFTKSHSHHSLHTKQSAEYLLIVILYVDDLILLASDMGKMEELKAKLEGEYEMSDHGELHFCLGVEFERDRVARCREVCCLSRKAQDFLL